MRVHSLEAWPVEMGLDEPYTIAYETVDSVENVFVRITTDGPIVGYGCAAPDAMVTGETTRSVLDAIEQVAKPQLAGADPLRPALHLEALGAALSRQPAARAAIDMALYDLLGKSAGLPLWRLLGGYRDCIVTSITIGILSEEETTQAARTRVAEGFRCLKIKGGSDVELDIARVHKVREVVGEAVEVDRDSTDAGDDSPRPDSATSGSAPSR